MIGGSKGEWEGGREVFACLWQRLAQRGTRLAAASAEGRYARAVQQQYIRRYRRYLDCIHAVHAGRLEHAVVRFPGVGREGGGRGRHAQPPQQFDLTPPGPAATAGRSVQHGSAATGVAPLPQVLCCAEGTACSTAPAATPLVLLPTWRRTGCRRATAPAPPGCRAGCPLRGSVRRVRWVQQAWSGGR